MFGTYRFILAGFVVLTHIWPSPYHHAGLYAVFSFYMLSGYLMTMVMNERYGFSRGGIGKFLTNRALRIYPAYLICAGMTAVMVYAFPWLTWQVSRTVVMPGSIVQWLPNIFIFGIDAQFKTRFVPQAWSLYVELFFYLLICLILARKKVIVIGWLLFSLTVTIYLNAAGAGLNERYFSIVAGSLPFSLGATVYFFRDEFGKARPGFIIAAGVFYVLNILNLADVHGVGMYQSLFLSVVLLVSLKDLKIPALKKADNLLGDLSYPIYVSHIMVGIFVLWTFWPDTPKHRGLDFFLITFIYTLVFSYIVHSYIERPINRLRENVKGSEVRDRRVNRTVVSSTFITKNGDQSRA